MATLIFQVEVDEMTMLDWRQYMAEQKYIPIVKTDAEAIKMSLDVHELDTIKVEYLWQKVED